MRHLNISIHSVDAVPVVIVSGTEETTSGMILPTSGACWRMLLVISMQGRTQYPYSHP